jgi:hypothetical protein
MIPSTYLPLIKWGGIALIGVGFGWWLGGRGEATAHAQTKAKHAETMRAIAEEAREVATKVRLREHQVAQDVAAIATAYEDQRNAIQSTARAAVLADIRSGRIRLRDHTQAVPAAAQAATPASGSDGQAKRGGQAEGDMVPRWWVEERASESVAAGIEDDAQLTACQATLQAYANITEAK